MPLTTSTLTTISDVTENMPLSPAQFNQRFDALSKNINEVNDTATYDQISVSTLTVQRSGHTLVVFVAGDGSVRIQTATSTSLTFGTNSSPLWQILHVNGALIPVTNVSAGVGSQDIGIANTPLRAIWTNHVGSLATMATMSVLSVGEMGLVQQSSGLSLVIRSGDTYYDLGSGTSVGV